MSYKVSIAKNEGMLSADIQRSGAVVFEEFDLYAVIGDFFEIRAVEGALENHHEKRVSFNLQEHIFTKMPSKLKQHHYFYYQEEMYPDIQLAFRFAKRYLSRINSSAHPSKMENAFSNILKRYHVDIHIQLNGFLTNNHADSSACYTCTKISDVIAAILHYYMVNDFKLIKCEHCNRYFAASTRKAKYCPRLSPYIDAFSQKPVKARRKCEQTVRNAMQQLSRKRYRFEPEPTDKEYGEFAQACEEYVNLLNQKHSIANLTAYNEYLESRKRRRKKENR